MNIKTEILKPATLCSKCHTNLGVDESDLIESFELDTLRAYVPHPWHPDVIQEKRDAIHTGVTRIDEEVAALNNMITTLQVRRRLFEAAQARLCPSPIRKLPAELHLIIFQYAFDNLEPSGFLAVSLVITSVCYRWRQLALSTPRLWTTIFASVDGQSHQLSNDALVNLHLERSGDLPLAVKITAFNADRVNICDDEVKASKHWFPQFAKLYNNFARWESAELVLTQVEMRRLDKFVNGASLPLLRSLKLVLTNDQLAQPYKTFLKAPKLDRVHARADTIRLPWNQITHFTACRRTSQDISPWLRVREGKENYLTLHTLGEQFHPVHHARLTIPLALTSLDLDLRLGLLYYGGRHSPLRHFTVPFLKALTVRITQFRPGRRFEEMEDIAAFIQASKCSLDTFCVILDARMDPKADAKNYNDISVAMKRCAYNVQSILDASPGLRRLQIIDSPAFTSVPGLLGPELLERLASTAFLPLLTSIELVWCQNMLDNVLVNMLNCRMATGQAALRQVKIGLRDGRELSYVVAQFMNSLRHRGIQATTW